MLKWLCSLFITLLYLSLPSFHLYFSFRWFALVVLGSSRRVWLHSTMLIYLGSYILFSITSRLFKLFYPSGNLLVSAVRNVNVPSTMDMRCCG
jgi:hypothetical protein